MTLMDTLKQQGSNKLLVEYGNRLNNYLNSIDTDLKKIFEAFNGNFVLLFERLDKIEARLNNLENIKHENKKK